MCILVTDHLTGTWLLCVCVCVHAHVCVPACLGLCLCDRAHACTFMCMYLHVCVCVFTLVYEDPHTHMCERIVCKVSLIYLIWLATERLRSHLVTNNTAEVLLLLCVLKKNFSSSISIFVIHFITFNSSK